MTEPTNDARLEKIQGGVDLINERLKHANELQNERHEAVRKDIERLDAADTALGGRVDVLEADRSERVGQLKGLALSGRILWTIIGAVPVGLGAIALKLLGV
jgi:hypothetical protein